MTTLHVGCAGFSAPRTRYARKLSFVEIEVARPAPTPKVLARWREEIGDAMVWSIVAPAVLWGDRESPLRDEKATQVEIDRLVNVVKPIGARALLLRTPPTIRPGSVAAKRFLTVAERVRKMAPVVVWEPSGLWERRDAQAFVKHLGLIVACDPLRDEVAGEPIMYARMRGLGADRRYHQGRLEDILLAFAGVEEGFVVFDTAQSFAEAVRLRGLIEGLAAGGEGAESEDADDLDEEDEDELDEENEENEEDLEDGDDEDGDDEDGDDEDADEDEV